jgi:hypothetical protein
MKRALVPLILIFAGVVLLIAAAWFYERQWGSDGPFQSGHQHGGAGDEHERPHE